jgi:hypothetical protein
VWALRGAPRGVGWEAATGNDSSGGRRTGRGHRARLRPAFAGFDAAVTHQQVGQSRGLQLEPRM